MQYAEVGKRSKNPHRAKDLGFGELLAAGGKASGDAIDMGVGHLLAGDCKGTYQHRPGFSRAWPNVLAAYPHGTYSTTQEADSARRGFR